MKNKKIIFVSQIENAYLFLFFPQGYEGFQENCRKILKIFIRITKILNVSHFNKYFFKIAILSQNDKQTVGNRPASPFGTWDAQEMRGQILLKLSGPRRSLERGYLAWNPSDLLVHLASVLVVTVRVGSQRTVRVVSPRTVRVVSPRTIRVGSPRTIRVGSPRTIRVGSPRLVRV